MPQTCTVCRHPRRGEIDRALVSAGPLRDIAGRFGVSKSAVERHKAEHLPAVLARAKEVADVTHALDVAKQLMTINGVAYTLIREAMDATPRDTETVLKAMDRVQRQLEMQARLLGELDDRPTVNVLVTAEWARLRGALMEALAPFEEARVAVAAALVAAEAGEAVHAAG